uniref:tyrosine-type recombinase/integrase n=1 Tax=Sphingomonas sp. TaxID=28214 RepID=UPI003750B10F
WRFRKTGQRTYYFRNPPDTPGFKQELEACLASGPITVGADRAVPLSVSDLLVRYYASVDFNGGGDGDQQRRRLLLESFRADFGNDMVRGFTFEHVEKILLDRSQKRTVGNRTVGGKVAAQNLRKQLRRLFAHAKRIGWIPTNPVDDATRIKSVKTEGYHTWTEEEIAHYQEHHAIGTRARLALEIILWTGQRRGDALLFGPEHMKRGKINFRARKNGRDLWLPAAPQLLDAINAMRRVGLKTYLVTEAGNPFSGAGLGNKMREWCNQAGLPQCAAHGLRKAIARRLAEMGAGNQGIKAVGGWSGDSEVSIYTAAADQERLADATLGQLVRLDLANRHQKLAKAVGEAFDNE